MLEVGTPHCEWLLNLRLGHPHGRVGAITRVGQSCRQGSRVGVRALYVGQMGCTWSPRTGASAWWVLVQGVEKPSYGTHPPESEQVKFTNCAALAVEWPAPPVDPCVVVQCYVYIAG